MSTYRIEYSREAAKQLARLDNSVYKQIEDEIKKLAADPRPHGYLKLKGEAGLFRVRTGDYRIIYQIVDAVLVVLDVRIGDRKEVYE